MQTYNTLYFGNLPTPKNKKSTMEHAMCPLNNRPPFISFAVQRVKAGLFLRPAIPG